MLAIEFRHAKPLQILTVTSGPKNDSAPLLEFLRKTFMPNRVLAVASEADLAQTQEVIPLFEDKRAIGGRTTVYVCRERVCRLPASSLEELAKVLEPGIH